MPMRIAPSRMRTQGEAWGWLRSGASSTAVVVVASLCVSPLVVGGQPTPTLQQVVTTAERAPNMVGRTAAAVVRVEQEELARLPQATFADVLRTLPGFAVLDFNGMGFDPQVITRGFYGGGEAEYVLVLLDGKPLNQVHTGRAIWEALPTGTQVEAIEIVRGGASALYGDAAVGGVINIITKAGDPDAPRFVQRYGIGGGGFGLMQADLSAAGSRGSLTLGATGTRGDGYRAHSERLAGHLRARLTPWRGGRGELTLNYLRQVRRADEPGPLPQPEADADPRRSSVLHRFDQQRDVHDELSAEGLWRLTQASRLTWFGVAGRRALDSDRSIVLAPGFADVQGRETDLRRLMGLAQYDLTFGRHDLTLGAEVQRGEAQSEYFAVLTGDEDDFAASSGERGPALGAADASRLSSAAYLQFAVAVNRRVRITLGGRYDRLSDGVTPSGSGADPAQEVTHDAFSPRVGLNLRSGSNGSAYVSAGRVFKAPTLDQLFDQRAFPVPFPPFAIRSSNAGLAPARGRSVEIGGQQALTLGAHAMATLSLSLYDMAMRDEIDFDVATLSYGNIARSRHRGVEAGARVTGPHGLSGFANWTVQAATVDGGDNDGKQLKAVPRHALSAGATITARGGLETGLVAVRTGEAFFDDANTRPIAAWTRVDARVVARLGTAQLTAELRNLFDARYVSTGYLDPAGSGLAYVHPAAGRLAMLGLRWLR